MRACCLQYKPASEASGPAGAHRSAAREGGAAIKPGGETTRAGWEGEAASVRGACGSVLLKQKGTAGTPQRKNPSHLLRTTRIVAPEQLPYPNSVKMYSLESQKYHLPFLYVRKLGFKSCLADK